jgi:hypothetical protein
MDQSYKTIFNALLFQRGFRYAQRVRNPSSWGVSERLVGRVGETLQVKG